MPQDNSSKESYRIESKKKRKNILFLFFVNTLISSLRDIKVFAKKSGKMRGVGEGNPPLIQSELNLSENNEKTVKNQEIHSKMRRFPAEGAPNCSPHDTIKK